MISVIIPIYNVASYITDCLQSVINQTYTDLEVLLIDDCGTDDSIQIAERIVKEYKGPIHFRILYQDKNMGPSAARNKGMDVAKGKYISFIDSDDYITPDFYEKMLNALEKEDKSVGILACCCNTDTGGIISDSFFTNVDKKITLLPEEYAEAMLLTKVPHMVGAKLYCREVFDNIRFRVGRRNEDTLLAFDLFPEVEKRKIKTVIIPDRLYYYRQHEESKCHSKDSPLVFDEVENLEEIMSKISKIKPYLYKELQCLYTKSLFIAILKSMNMRKMYAYCSYCRKLWNIPVSIARQSFNSNDFRVFCMMKYLPFIYYVKYSKSKS